MKKKPIPKGYILYYSIDRTLVKWQTYRKQIRTGEQMTGIKDGVGGERDWCGYRMTTWGFCGDGNFLYLDCINANILFVIFYYLFTRYYWGE